MPTLDLIQEILSRHQPATLANAAKKAAVAMLLSGPAAAPEMLMIRRAQHAGDPWSGDLGFPGGKVEPEDTSARETAEREVSEEIGLCLAESSYLGRLDDIAGAYLPVHVACFVYHIENRVEFELNHEITNFWWIPLASFLEPERHRQAAFTYRQQHRARPVIDLVEPEHPFLWGITYRLVEQFFALIEHPLPKPPTEND